MCQLKQNVINCMYKQSLHQSVQIFEYLHRHGYLLKNLYKSVLDQNDLFTQDIFI